MAITKQQATELMDKHLKDRFEYMLSSVCNELIARLNKATACDEKRAKGTLRVGYSMLNPYQDIKCKADCELMGKIALASTSDPSISYKKILKIAKGWDLRHWCSEDGEDHAISFEFYNCVGPFSLLTKTGKKVVSEITERLSKHGFNLKFFDGGCGVIAIKYKCAVKKGSAPIPLHGGKDFTKQLAGTKAAIIEMFVDESRINEIKETQDEVSYIFNMSSDKFGRSFGFMVACDASKDALNLALVVGRISAENVENVERVEELLEELKNNCLKEMGLDGYLSETQGVIMLRHQTIIEEDTDTYEICVRMSDKIDELVEGEMLAELVALTEQV